MRTDYLILLFILALGAFLAIKTGKLTQPAAYTGCIISLLVYTGCGYTGVAMIAVFFILGTAATAWKINLKQQLGIAEREKGKRTAGQVLANAGASGIIGLLILLFPQHTDLLRLMIAGSLASAAADTLSSELGNVYGRRFYNIVTMKKDTRGENGVVSLEGTVAGIAGSTVISIVFASAYGFNSDTLLIILAGTIGNSTDSIMGATLERKKIVSNNGVNFLNTATGGMALC